MAKVILLRHGLGEAIMPSCLVGSEAEFFRELRGGLGGLMVVQIGKAKAESRIGVIW